MRMMFKEARTLSRTATVSDIQAEVNMDVHEVDTTYDFRQHTVEQECEGA